MDGHVLIPVFQPDGWIAETVYTDFVFGENVFSILI